MRLLRAGVLRIMLMLLLTLLLLILAQAIQAAEPPPGIALLYFQRK